MPYVYNSVKAPWVEVALQLTPPLKLNDVRTAYLFLDDID